MGSLNTFYLMGRVARSASPAGNTRGGVPIVTFSVAPGTTGPRRAPDAVDLEASGPQAEQAVRLRVGQSVFVRGALRPAANRGVVAMVTALELVVDPRPPRPPRERAPGEAAGAEGAEGAPPAEGEGAPVEGAPVGEGAPAGEAAEAITGDELSGEGEVGEAADAGDAGDGAPGGPVQLGPDGLPLRRRRGRRRGRGPRREGDGRGPDGRGPAAPPRPLLADSLPPPAPIAPTPPAPARAPADPTYRSDMPF